MIHFCLRSSIIYMKSKLILLLLAVVSLQQDYVGQLVRINEVKNYTFNSCTKLTFNVLHR